MARSKKQEISLQAEIESQEEWEEMLAKEGLTVVDVYQEWAGPCKGMISNFKRLKNELGDDLLRYSVAKADTVDALDRYRGHCEPCFLFFGGGVLVAQVRGANAPLLQRAITEQLAHEHKVLEGQAERKEIRDPMLTDTDDRGGDDEEEEDEEGITHKGEKIIFDGLPEFAGEEQKKGVTVAIIKPNVVAEGKAEEVMAKMRDAGIEILRQEERTFSEEQAREFYSHKKDEEYFEDLVQFMTSGPSHVLVLSKGETGDNIVNEWRELLGPASVEEAKEQAPESWRAQFGGDKAFVNALHGSDSQETAMRELAFFFPDFAAPGVAGRKKSAKVQRTLALIRPDALREKKDEILAKIAEAGFRVAMQKEISLSKEQAEEFYKEHRGQEYFEELTTRMSNGPLLALALAREEAVTGWREMLGPAELEKAKEEAPQSLRAQFSVEETSINQLHGSDSEQTAQQEINYFFPMQQTVAVIKPDAYQTKDEIMSRIREAGFHIAARKETELTPEIAKQLYKDKTGAEYFDDLTNHMTSGPTLFMVLSREDAVDGWRSVIGPTDPEKAKAEAPESLRAKYGTDIKANAVHGSSNPQHAEESMKLIFGDSLSEGEGAGEKAEAPKETEQPKETEPTESGEEQSEQKQDEGEEQKQDEPKEEEKEATDDQGAAEQTEQQGEEQAGQQDPDASSQKGEEEAAPHAEAQKEGDSASQKGAEDSASQKGAEESASQKGAEGSQEAAETASQKGGEEPAEEEGGDKDERAPSAAAGEQQEEGAEEGEEEKKEDTEEQKQEEEEKKDEETKEDAEEKKEEAEEKKEEEGEKEEDKPAETEEEKKDDAAEEQKAEGGSQAGDADAKSEDGKKEDDKKEEE